MAHKIVFHKQKHAFRVLINVNRRRPKGVTHTANKNMRNKTSSTRQTVVTLLQNGGIHEKEKSHFGIASYNDNLSPAMKYLGSFLDTAM